MGYKFFFVLVATACLAIKAYAQPCSALGQNPSTAFPVCGIAVFNQTTVPNCGGTLVPSTCPEGGFADVNPFWYKFTCFQSGTLGFLIEPIDGTDDYDWQLFDVTNHNPNDVYTDASLFVSCNWSGLAGNTGSSSAGTVLVNCSGYGYPTFSKMPDLIEGHNYLLLLSHFTALNPGQEGYKLSFGGGTANITDPTEPKLKAARAACGGSVMHIKLNKKMKCGTLAPDGSDFTLTPAAGNITGAKGVGCTTGFDMDSVVLTLDGQLAPGNYTITVKSGKDSNTLMDYCDRSIPENDQVPVTVYPVEPTPMDSIMPVTCAPDTLYLVFRNNMKCSSIAANGSDFVVTGPSGVKVTDAGAVCADGLTTIIKLHLASPITTAGNYTVELRTGTDGNTLVDECGLETPAGSKVNVRGYDTVNANFDYHIFYGCNTDTVAYVHDGAHGVNDWSWTFDQLLHHSGQNMVINYMIFGSKTATLAVSNGVCTDTLTKTLLLDNTLKAAFEAPVDLCPEDVAEFKNNSVAKNATYTWNFGNGSVSFLRDVPGQRYNPPVTRQKFYQISLIVTDAYKCSDTAMANVRVLNTCLIAVPGAFTPNSDGNNDYLYPLNAYKATNLQFRVYNRLGQLIFYTQDWTNKWDGTFKGNPQPTGTYAWMLSYTQSDTGEQYFYKGTSVLLR